MKNMGMVAGFCALQRAVANNNLKMVKLILEKAGERAEELVLEVDQFGNTFLHQAASKKNQEMIILFLEKAGERARELVCTVSKSGETALHQAIVSNNNIETIKLILEKAGEDISKLICQVGEFDNTALHLATYKNNLEMVKLILQKVVKGEKVQELVCQVDQFGNTAFHTAAYKNNLDIVKLILQKAGERAQELICQVDKSDKTALHIAAQRQKKELVKELLKYDQDLNLKDQYGQTSFDYCFQNLEICKLFYENGAIPSNPEKIDKQLEKIFNNAQNVHHSLFSAATLRYYDELVKKYQLKENQLNNNSGQEKISALISKISIEQLFQHFAKQGACYPEVAESRVKHLQVALAKIKPENINKKDDAAINDLLKSVIKESKIAEEFIIQPEWKIEQEKEEETEGEIEQDKNLAKAVIAKHYAESAWLKLCNINALTKISHNEITFDNITKIICSALYDRENFKQGISENTASCILIEQLFKLHFVYEKIQLPCATGKISNLLELLQNTLKKPEFKIELEQENQEKLSKFNIAEIYQEVSKEFDIERLKFFDKSDIKDCKNQPVIRAINKVALRILEENNYFGATSKTEFLKFFLYQIYCSMPFEAFVPNLFNAEEKIIEEIIENKKENVMTNDIENNNINNIITEHTKNYLNYDLVKYGGIDSNFIVDFSNYFGA